jgi:hypothetical protein
VRGAAMSCGPLIARSFAVTPAVDRPRSRWMPIRFAVAGGYPFRRTAVPLPALRDRQFQTARAPSASRAIANPLSVYQNGSTDKTTLA